MDVSLRNGGIGLRRALERASDALAWFEARLAGALLAAILCLLLANVVSRALGAPLIWTDELAVYLLAMGAFAGASLGVRNRRHIAVTLLADALGARARRWMARAVDTVLLAIFLCLGIMLWNWFDPLGVLAAEDMRSYARSTFNFMHQEPTTTLGLRKVWFWLALPLFCVSGAVHVLAGFGRPEGDR